MSERELPVGVEEETLYDGSEDGVITEPFNPKDVDIISQPMTISNLADRLEGVIKNGRSINDTAAIKIPAADTNFRSAGEKESFSVENIGDSKSEAEMELLKALRAINNE